MLRILEGLVGKAVSAAREHCIGQAPASGKVEVGEERLTRADHRILGLERFLDLHDQPCFAVDVFGGGGDLCTLVCVLGIGDPRAKPRSHLDQDLMPVVDKTADACRHHADPSFLYRDLFGNADNHELLLLLTPAASWGGH